MSKIKVSVQQVLNHLERVAKNGNKGSINFLCRNREEILKEVWNELDITAEQTLATIWRNNIEESREEIDEEIAEPVAYYSDNVEEVDEAA